MTSPPQRPACALFVTICPGKMRHPGTKSLWGVLRCKEPGFVDLLECCLRWDPAERLTPEQAMSHPWILEPLVQQSGSSTTQRCVACTHTCTRLTCPFQLGQGVAHHVQHVETPKVTRLQLVEACTCMFNPASNCTMHLL